MKGRHTLHSTPRMHQSFLEYHEAFEHRMSAWRHEVLFTWEWWLGVIFTIIPWILWLVLRKKDNTDRLFYAGLFVGLITVTLDNIGFQLGLWEYFKPVMPAIPSYIPFDYGLMPVIVMLLIQFFTNKNPWMIGFFFAVLAAYVGEPIFEWLNIYTSVHWRHIYSIPFYTVIYWGAFKIYRRKFFEKIPVK
jgi:hypothetical protein